jgi:thioredoxin-like negative regulator of GroEL
MNAPRAGAQPARRWLIGFAVALGLVAIGWAVLRPLLQRQRAEKFIVNAAEAANAGKIAEAELNFRSALSIDPDNPTARLRLAVLLIEQRRYAEAATLAAPVAAQWGGSGDQFIHDTLLSRLDFIRLGQVAAVRIVDRSPQAPLWIGALRDCLEITGGRFQDTAKLPPLAAALIQTQAARLADRPAEAVEILLAAPRQELTPTEGMLVFEEFINLGRYDHAATTLSRFRHFLSPFEAALTDYMLDARPAPEPARRALRALLDRADRPARLAAVVATVIRLGQANHASDTLAALRERAKDLTPELRDAAWTLACTFQRPGDALFFAEEQQRLTGRRPPEVLGANLSVPDKNLVAFRAAAAQLTLPREVTFAVALRTVRAR